MSWSSWLSSGKTGSRRAEVRKKRPDTTVKLLRELQADGGLISLWVAGVFAVLAIGILSLRDQVAPYRPGQFARHDIVSRVDFAYPDPDKLKQEIAKAREETPHVYKATTVDPWKNVEQKLLGLPDQLANMTLEEVKDETLRKTLDEPSLAMIQNAQSPATRRDYERSVQDYMSAVRKLDLIVLDDTQRQQELARVSQGLNRAIVIPGDTSVRPNITYGVSQRDPMIGKFTDAADKNFKLALVPKIAALTAAWILPTHELDEAATTEAQNHAEERVPRTAGTVNYKALQPIVKRGLIKQDDWALLQAENNAYQASIANASWVTRLGLAGVVLLLTTLLSGYIAKYQPRVVRNHQRAFAVASLLLLMLLLPALAGIGSSSLYLFGVAPTILVAVILAITFDQRFALGMGTLHGILVTLAVNADLNFFLILLAGVVTACLLLDDLRTRSKLIEIGGATALAMIAATIATGMLNMDPPRFITRECLYTGAAGLAVGFIVLGILPTIEWAFRITTSMTLLELADVSQPLLRRLSMEAPGTYAHSLQVAALSEEAAEAIGANALLCRVAAYYHDAGKIHKPDYFIENQTEGCNRHLNLNPSMSLLIIINHVKDGLELAREYNLPTSIFPFIQQHHGTTLVEFFYHRARTQREQQNPDGPAISESEYRYPGPKPKSKEIAIVMLADAVESATRAMSEPTMSRIEALVNELAMKRLVDKQFDECDLTMRDLDKVKTSLVKTLTGIYHGRIPYPSTAATTSAPSHAAPAFRIG